MIPFSSGWGCLVIRLNLSAVLRLSQLIKLKKTAQLQHVQFQHHFLLHFGFQAKVAVSGQAQFAVLIQIQFNFSKKVQFNDSDQVQEPIYCCEMKLTT